MPVNPVFGAIAGAAAGVGSSLINAGAQRRLNRESQAWNEKMFQIQDERDMRNWTMTNEYNSPQAQMKRLQAAGLNPHLVYGNGSAVNTSSEPHSSAPQSWNPKSPEIDLRSPVSDFFNIEMKTAQTDNLKAQNTVLLEEAMLKKAQTRATLANAGLSEFNLGFKTDSRGLSFEAMKEDVRSKTLGNYRSGIDNMWYEAVKAAQYGNLTQDTLLKAANTANVNLDRSRIQSTINNINNDSELKKLEIDLQKNGMSKTDPAWLRIIARYLNFKYGSLFK